MRILPVFVIVLISFINIEAKNSHFGKALGYNWMYDLRRELNSACDYYYTQLEIEKAFWSDTEVTDYLYQTFFENAQFTKLSI